MKKVIGNGIGIVGIGAYLPAEKRTNDWWPESFKTAHAKNAPSDLVNGISSAIATKQDVDPEIVEVSAAYENDIFRGSKVRYVIGEKEEPSDMEVAAAKLALADANLTPEDIDLLIVYSAVSDTPLLPLNDPLVAHKLGLPRHTMSISVSAACASFIPNFIVATRLIETGEATTALIIQSSATSRVIDYRKPSSVNVGDGAVATIIKRIEPEFGYIGSYSETIGKLHYGMRIAPTDYTGQARWHNASVHQSDLTFQNTDPQAIRIMGTKSASFAAQTCNRLLDKYNLSIKDVDFLVTTHSTVWFTDACCKALGLDPKKTISTYPEYGHIFPASVPLNMWAARERNLLKNGDLVIFYGPGAGLVQGSFLYRWNSNDSARPQAH